MHQAFSELCFIQVESQGFNMAPITSDDSGDGAWKIRHYCFHSLLLPSQIFLATPYSTRRKSQTWGYFRDLKITPKMIFEIDTEFLFGDDSATNSIFSVFHVLQVQTNRLLGHFTPWGPRNQGFSSIVCTVWREIYREYLGTKLDVTTNRTGCSRWETIR